MAALPAPSRRARGPAGHLHALATGAVGAAARGGTGPPRDFRDVVALGLTAPASEAGGVVAGGRPRPDAGRAPSLRLGGGGGTGGCVAALHLACGVLRVLTAQPCAARGERLPHPRRGAPPGVAPGLRAARARCSRSRGRVQLPP